MKNYSLHLKTCRKCKRSFKTPYKTGKVCFTCDPRPRKGGAKSKNSTFEYINGQKEIDPKKKRPLTNSERELLDGMNRINRHEHEKMIRNLRSKSKNVVWNIAAD